ncbi:MAG: hypothetical protein RLZZ385_1729 [Pseudomonadota bacterium]|jgi:CRP-like cAMP-binding protein
MNQPSSILPTVIQPSQGSRVYQDRHHTILFGLPPEVLKGLLIHKVRSFDTVVLTDVREKHGALLNSLEFPLYSFLFIGKAFAQGQRLNLVGDEAAISHVLRLLRLTLLGPTAEELEHWGTDSEQREEWLAASEYLALKNKAGQVLQVEEFFNIMPFQNGQVDLGGVVVHHTGIDSYRVDDGVRRIVVDLNEDKVVNPPYRVNPDYVPGGLVKLGIEVLGGASGFTPTEPCTGIALCYNGEYMLIDAIPFLDQHLFARGISKNQIAALFLTHLHDDHCSMFPLMLMPHRVEVITTPEIFSMAMEKLACGLGWSVETVTEHFKLVPITPGERFNYFGLTIEPHVTVHSIPTIGAVFSTVNKGMAQQVCVIGDNHTMTAIRDMREQGLVRPATVANLERLYAQRFSLLVADGGAGAIHGDPADAINSDSDRVVFVHVEELPREFNTTFSLASSGKRYTLLEGDSAIYTSQINHYLTVWLGKPFPNRWMRSLLADEEVRRYNTDDVILVQDAETRGYVYLVLTGYCDVVRHDGKQLYLEANLQAGDILGEMAIITGKGLRNASVVARTPVTVCVFSEETFKSFMVEEKFDSELLLRWSVRPAIRRQPQFADLTSTVIEKVSQIATLQPLAAGESLDIDADTWCLLSAGDASFDLEPMSREGDYGAAPFVAPRPGRVSTRDGCVLILVPATRLHNLRLEVPQLNYTLRKPRARDLGASLPWVLGTVATVG